MSQSTDSTSPLATGPICLVTGGTGYLGSAIIQRLLDQGPSVHSFDRIPCSIEHPQLIRFVGDIRQYDDLAAACQGVSTGSWALTSAARVN